MSSYTTLAKRFGVGFSPPPASDKPEVEITGIEATPVREPDSRRSYVVLTVQTSKGVTGVGEAPARPDPLTAAAQFEKLRPLLEGQDARSYIPIDQQIIAEAPVPDTDAVRGAVNMALLDILGKLTDTPLYEVLGGPTRDKARAMAVIAGESNMDLRQAVLAAHAAGYRAFSVPLPEQDGPSRGREYFRKARGRLDYLRDAVGEDADFVLDCGGNVTPAVGLSIAAACESFHLLWLEEPGGDVSAEALSALSNNSVVPVGYGRSIANNARFQDLLRLDGIDVLRPDISRSGVTQIRKAAALAETYYIAIAPYHRGGPIGSAAALHAGVSLGNFYVQEVPWAAGADRSMRDKLVGVALEKPDDGYFPLPPGPGLGVKLNRDVLNEFRVKG
jgi:galactonate dehydratase